MWMSKSNKLINLDDFSILSVEKDCKSGKYKITAKSHHCYIHLVDGLTKENAEILLKRVTSAMSEGRKVFELAAFCKDLYEKI